MNKKLENIGNISILGIVGKYEKFQNKDYYNSIKSNNLEQLKENYNIKIEKITDTISVYILKIIKYFNKHKEI